MERTNQLNELQKELQQRRSKQDSLNEKFIQEKVWLFFVY